MYLHVRCAAKASPPRYVNGYLGSSSKTPDGLVLLGEIPNKEFWYPLDEACPQSPVGKEKLIDTLSSRLKMCLLIR